VWKFRLCGNSGCVEIPVVWKFRLCGNSGCVGFTVAEEDRFERKLSNFEIKSEKRIERFTYEINVSIYKATPENVFHGLIVFDPGDLHGSVTTHLHVFYGG